MHNALKEGVGGFEAWRMEFKPLLFQEGILDGVVVYNHTGGDFTVLRTYGKDAEMLEQLKAIGFKGSIWAVVESDSGPLVVSEWMPFTPRHYVICKEPCAANCLEFYWRDLGTPTQATLQEAFRPSC